MASTAVAIGVGEVIAGVLGATSAIGAVGALIISLQPPGAKDFMVSLFGTNDKLALEIMVFVGGVLLGALIGLAGKVDRRIVYGAFVVAGVVGFVLIVQDPLTSQFTAAVTVAASVAAGLTTFMWLTAMLLPVPVPATRGSKRATPAQATGGANMPRRGFLVIGGTFVAVGAVLSVIGRFLGSQVPTQSTTPVAVPPAQSTLAPPPSGADFDIPNITPIVVANNDFYLIDTRLSTPEIDASTWKLRIYGMVDKRSPDL